MRHARWVALTAVGAVGLGACSSGSSSTSTTAAPSTPTTATPTTPTTAATASTTATTAASDPGGGGGGGGIPGAPAGAQQLQNGTAGGATYTRYSISGQTPVDVVNTYKGELTTNGFTVTQSGAGGGGWGEWGGSEAGLTANDGSQYVAVNAGGQKSGPTYFEVCVGSSAQSVKDCENISQGPDEDEDSNTKSGSS